MPNIIPDFNQFVPTLSRKRAYVVPNFNGGPSAKKCWAEALDIEPPPIPCKGKQEITGSSCHVGNARPPLCPTAIGSSDLEPSPQPPVVRQKPPKPPKVSVPTLQLPVQDDEQLSHSTKGNSWTSRSLGHGHGDVQRLDKDIDVESVATPTRASRRQPASARVSAVFASSAARAASAARKTWASLASPRGAPAESPCASTPERRRPSPGSPSGREQQAAIVASPQKRLKASPQKSDQSPMMTPLKPIAETAPQRNAPEPPKQKKKRWTELMSPRLSVRSNSKASADTGVVDTPKRRPSPNAEQQWSSASLVESGQEFRMSEMQAAAIEAEVITRHLLTAVYEQPLDDDQAFAALDACPEIGWLVQCAMNAPLPAAWYKSQMDGFNPPQYTNFENNEVTEVLPTIRHFATLARLAAHARQNTRSGPNAIAWVRATKDDALREAARLQQGWTGPYLDTATRVEFWHCPATGVSSWSNPTAAALYVAEVADRLLQSPAFLVVHGDQQTLEDLSIEIQKTHRSRRHRESSGRPRTSRTSASQHRAQSSRDIIPDSPSCNIEEVVCSKASASSSSLAISSQDFATSSSSSAGNASSSAFTPARACASYSVLAASSQDSATSASSSSGCASSSTFAPAKEEAKAATSWKAVPEPKTPEPPKKPQHVFDLFDGGSDNEDMVPCHEPEIFQISTPKKADAQSSEQAAAALVGAAAAVAAAAAALAGSNPEAPQTAATSQLLDTLQSLGSQLAPNASRDSGVTGHAAMALADAAVALKAAAVPTSGPPSIQSAAEEDVDFAAEPLQVAAPDTQPYDHKTCYVGSPLSLDGAPDTDAEIQEEPTGNVTKGISGKLPCGPPRKLASVPPHVLPANPAFQSMAT